MPSKHVVYVTDGQVAAILKSHGIVDVSRDCSNGSPIFEISNTVAFSKAYEIYARAYPRTFRYMPEVKVRIREHKS